MGKLKQNDGGERLREEDLLIEVLSRLDVKTLLQCKAVSKAWYSLISSPIFIKSHLNRGLTITTLIVRLFKNEPRCDSPEEDGSFSLFELGGCDSPEEDGSFSLFELGGCDDFVKHLQFPYSKGDYTFTPSSLLIGCVCGVVCVCVDPNARIKANCCGPPRVKERTDIYIWNPATKQSKLIPTHNTLYDCDDRVKAALGFGFDPIDFDFKVVRVLSRAIFPEVYSVNRNVWRKIETQLSDIPYRNNFDICLHGYLFAIGHSGMMAFDVNKEVFLCDIKLPVCSNDACIADFKDSIAVIIFFKEKSDRIKLWTLDDEACLCGTGVKASWTLMLTVDVGWKFDWVYGIFNSAEFLLAVGDWFSYNLDKKEGRCMNTNPFFDFDEFLEYTESLLPVAGSKLVNWSADEDDNMESSSDSEEVSEECSFGLEDDNEESTADSEDSEESNEDSEDNAGDE